MFEEKTTTSKPRSRRLTAMISLVLCVAITLNTGCSSVNQTTQAYGSKAKLSEATPAKNKQPNQQRLNNLTAWIKL